MRLVGRHGSGRASALSELIVAQKGFAEGDAHTVLTIRKGVQSYLRRQSGALVDPRQERP